MGNKMTITGLGYYVPEKVLTNQDLEKMVDTNDEWITTRTGIKERHIADENQATSDLCFEASINAIKDAGIDKEDIDCIIVATITPDMLFPSTACVLQDKLGLKNIPAFDISAACTGFIYGMTIAKSFIESGQYKNILLLGAESLTKITDWNDRGTCVLFGDGAGAAILSSHEGEGGVKSVYIGSDGSKGNLLYQPAGGSKIPASEESVKNGLHFVKMEGNTTFKNAVTMMNRSAKKALKLAGKTKEDVDLLIPHQANIRIIESTAHFLKIPMEKVHVTIDKYANTSAASIPMAAADAYKNGKIKKGDNLVLVAFGGGFTWGASFIEWTKE